VKVGLTWDIFHFAATDTVSWVAGQARYPIAMTPVNSYVH